MANQKIPTTDTVEDYTVEKTILSGAQFVSAILGSGAHLITAAAIPVFFRSPIISGSVVPPSTLTCEANSFNSSPRATITYQWKSDGVDINGETSITYDAVLSDIGAEITCFVTITNASGADTGLSNGLTMEAIVEAEMFEFDAYVIQGLNTPGRTDVNDIDMLIITGFANDDKIDVMEEEVTIVTGFGHPDKIDVNEGEAYGITGMGSSNKVDVNEADAYAVFLPIFLSDLVVLNGDAENSVMTDWTMDTGDVTSETTAAAGNPGDITLHREGLRFFVPDLLGQGVDSQMSQVVAIDSGDYTDVDTGRCYVLTDFLHQSNQGYDHLEITLQALNGAMSVIGTATTVVASNPEGDTFPRSFGWMRENTDNEPLSLPTLTRHVKLIVLFKAHATLGGDNSVYADDFHMKLVKTR